jgi:hypothetical protein
MGKSTTRRNLLVIVTMSVAILVGSAGPATAGELADQVRASFAGDVIYGGSGSTPPSVAEQFAKDEISGQGEYPRIEPGSIARQMQ